MYVDVRGRRLHCRRWGRPQDAKLLLLHGIHDHSASWQFTVDALERPWQVIAPDWRGFGLSDRGGGDTYTSADNVGDLALLIEQLSPGEPVTIVAHSMGGTLAAVYAGLFPERVARFVDVEGFGMRGSTSVDAVRCYQDWIRALQRPPAQKYYASVRELAERVRRESPRLTPERALFLAQAWANVEPDGRITRRADPAHRMPRATPWRLDEYAAIWSRIRAPMLWVEGTESEHFDMFKESEGGYESRLALFPTIERRERIAGAGHNVHHDQPERLAAVIEEFLSLP